MDQIRRCEVTALAVLDSARARARSGNRRHVRRALVREPRLAARLVGHLIVIRQSQFAVSSGKVNRRRTPSHEQARPPSRNAIEKKPNRPKQRERRGSPCQRKTEKPERPATSTGEDPDLEGLQWGPQEPLINSGSWANSMTLGGL